MLHEVTRGAKHEDGGLFRRWFQGETMDLFVWNGDDGLFHSFQLVYGKPDAPHALTWKNGRGFSHDRVDDGERPGSFKMTPILEHDGPVPFDDLMGQFVERSEKLPPEIVELVTGVLAELRRGLSPENGDE